LAGLFLGIAVAHGAEITDIRLTTPDHVEIMGTFYPADGDAAAPAVILLHDVLRNRTTWAPFAKLLQRNGLAALTIDLRGHGESIRRNTAAGPQRLDVQSFAPRDFSDMMLDINAAVDWLNTQPLVSQHKIAIVGSSLSANVAVRYAVFNEDLAGLVLLSPGLSYRELRTDDVFARLNALPVHIIVAHSDGYSYESTQRLLDLRHAGRTPPEKEVTVCTGEMHGTDLLRAVDGLPQILLGWLTKTLRATPSPAP